MQQPIPAQVAAISAGYGELPLAFEQNAGQWDHDVRYAARGHAGVLEIDGRGAVLRRCNTDSKSRSALKLGMRLVGSSSKKPISGERPLPGHVNYLRGRDTRNWKQNVPTFASVRCKQVYPGVDLVYYGTRSELEYDFEVAPGADPAAIRLEFTGAAHAQIDEVGDLVLQDEEGGVVRHRRPVVYQEIAGARRPVAADYSLDLAAGTSGLPTVAFELAKYDHSRPLVIDPVIVYSTYFGGGSLELSRGAGIALDAEGNAYLAGDTESADLPGTEGEFQGGRRDAFVTKLNPAGTAVLYTTYLGGSDSDVARGIAVDGSGQAHVVGETFSANFPTANAYQPTLHGFPGSDAFIAKLDATGGTLVYSTYLGGTTGSDSAAGVALDSLGNAWVVGSTSAQNFPSVGALQPQLGGGADAFVASLSPSGSSLLTSTFLGSTGTDRAAAVAIGPGNLVAVAGGTESAGFPVVGAVQPLKGFSRDGFVTLLSAGAGATLYSTFLGGGGVDSVTGAAIDPSGSVVVTGFTGSQDFPTANARQTHYGGRSDAFVSRFTPTGNSLIYSTYLGGSGTENNGSVETGGIAVDAEGSAFVTGFTGSRNFPTVGAFQKRSGGRTDAFAARLSPDGGELLYSTYLGGKLDEVGMAIAIDGEGNAYVGGRTASRNLPLRSPAQPKLSGSSDAFVSKLGTVDATTTPLLVLGSTILDFGTIRPNAFAIQPLRISNGGQGRLICGLSTPEPPFSILLGDTDFTISPRKSQRLFIQFKPTVPGEYSTNLELLSNDPYRPSTVIQLRGVMPAP